MEHPIHVGVLKRVLAQNSSAELTEKYADTVRNTRKTLDSLDSDICICNVAGNTKKKTKQKTWTSDQLQSG